MVRRSLLFSTLILVLAFAGRAAAQPQWDVAGTVGGLASHTPAADGDRYVDDWFHAVQAGLVVGRHLSRSVKIELEASGTGTGRQFVERLITVPGYPYPYPVGAESETSVRSVGAALTWQFGDNQWVHPFLRAGAAADFDRQIVRTWDQVFYPSDRVSGGVPTRVADQSIEGPTTTTAARLMVGGGAKFYVSPRAFVRTEGMASFGRSRQNVTLRLGLGIDF
jgi:hypothetical protein